MSFVGIKLALVVGICGGVPFQFGNNQQTEMILGDVVISNSVIEYDFGAQYPVGFNRKSDVKDTLGRPNRDIRGFLAGNKQDKKAIGIEALGIRQSRHPTVFGSYQRKVSRRQTRHLVRIILPTQAPQLPRLRVHKQQLILRSSLSKGSQRGLRSPRLRWKLHSTKASPG